MSPAESRKKSMTSPAETEEAVQTGYLAEPDYTRPLPEIPESINRRIREKLERLYGKDCGKAAHEEIVRLVRVHLAHKTPERREKDRNFRPEARFSEKDALLITYGDMIQGKGAPALQHLYRFAEDFLRGVFSGLHILPFFPYSSDRGFSVKDFERVDESMGSWADIAAFKSRFRLMMDLVLNHVSTKHRWFREFLNANPAFSDFFIAFESESEIHGEELRKIVRPRTTPVLTPFYTLNGRRLLWTTFSSDQVDLNYCHWPVLAETAGIMLYYVRRGADFIRLDAMTYLWKRLGTPCVHLEENHLVVKLFRDILDAAAPYASIITETNVPHSENIAYFGNGRDEAQMVYNFALPPLVLHTFLSGSSEKLTRWAKGLEYISDSATYFNFIDSHDGIGLPGAKGILDSSEIDMLVSSTEQRGGCISWKAEYDGSSSPYELNITFYSALNDNSPDEPEDLKIKRYLAARSIQLVLSGVPGVYIHGLLGSRNDTEAVEKEGTARSINRQTLDADSLFSLVSDSNTRTGRIFSGFSLMIKKRSRHRAFHPNSSQRAVFVSDRVFAVLRTAPEKTESILCITNVTDSEFCTELDAGSLGLDAGGFREILRDRTLEGEKGKLKIRLEPYDVMWIKPEA